MIYSSVLIYISQIILKFDVHLPRLHKFIYLLLSQVFYLILKNVSHYTKRYLHYDWKKPERAREKSNKHRHTATEFRVKQGYKLGEMTDMTLVQNT